MEIFKFNKNSGQKISKFNSDFIMSRIIQTTQAAHIGCMHLEKDGVVGYHRAVCPQLLLIVSGTGLVRGEQEEYVEVAAGDAVFWHKGEGHETRTENGLMAIVIESEELHPAIHII
ncbi:cupin [Planococcus maritimus]|uniref:cupin n=1 Tax=Planococcus maritimus TaxID=192421 RepID=UPI00080F0D0F|nr:cupin [Planococcus maritimus]ANU18436.1 cupin [Planococcus maritimus]